MPVTRTVKRNEFGRASSWCEAGIIAAFKREGQPVVTGVVQNTPIDTGALRETGRFEVVGKTLIIRFGGGDVDYAEYVHQGTFKMQGRPFLVDGVQRDAERIATAIASEIDKAMAR